MNLVSKNWEYLKIVTDIPKDYWSTKNEVVLEKENLKLRRFKNKSKSSNNAVLILPPQAGHSSNICDYAPDQSLVRLLLSYGLQVYATDWQSARLNQADLSIEDHINLTDDAVEKIREETGLDSITLIGQCQGGWQASVYTSLYQDKISKLVVAASPIDFYAERDFMNDYVDDYPMEFFEWLVKLGGGVMKGDFILKGFKSYDPYQHYIKKYQDLWKMILEDDKEGIERYKRFYNWYEYTQDLPGKFYLEVVEKIFKKNGMINPGTIVINNTSVDLSNITCPLFLLAGEKDNITPPRQCLEMANHVGTPKENIVQVTTKGGHIGTLTGSSALKKHWPKVVEFIENYSQTA
ncbi:alpha/beta fold hydrolase [Natranaerofaba carboxydovora]|uniref:alpha/beta fold hydrolase n=1 Tax=Natranaerofaba carboxydovora TaxID=2742683 RepID=UPI001F1303CF|nr:alpha/beta fold hydrolase [Natranaerofaba carboxydovora]UMZ74034.1 Poly(3-hydroxyalkanoate) polymerase subunit PhaC [Natranaerofaba carboxydovora]